MERLKGRTWDRWKVELDTLAPKTKRSYLDEFGPFLEWVGLNTEALYELYINTEYSDNRLDRGAVRMKVLEYLNHIDTERIKAKGKPYSGSKKRMVVNAVKSFFSSCEEKLDMGGKAPRVRRTGGARIVTKDQLRELEKFVMPGNYRDLSIIRMGKDSGLRIGDIANIKMGHVRAALDDPTIQFHQFTITQEKTGDDAYPIIGPEAIEALRQWAEQREKLGITSDYLYTSLHDNADFYRGGKLIEGSKIGDKIESGNITRLFAYLVRRAGLSGEKISAHSLRKYHSTRTVVGGLSDSMMKTLQGKDMGDSTEPYMEFTPEELMERYKQAYHELAIEERVEINELELRKQQARDAIDRLPISEDEKDRLKRTVDTCETPPQLVTVNKSIGKILRRERAETDTIIDESSLSNHLSHGYQFVAALSNGKYIVRKGS